MGSNQRQNYPEGNTQQERDYKMDKEVRKRIGEFLILFIYLLIEAFGIWPISHIWALTTTVAGIVALALLDGALSGLWVSIIGAAFWAISVGISACLRKLQRPGAAGFSPGPEVNQLPQMRVIA